MTSPNLCLCVYINYRLTEFASMLVICVASTARMVSPSLSNPDKDADEPGAM
jgi:hypothetical protein